MISFTTNIPNSLPKVVWKERNAPLPGSELLTTIAKINNLDAWHQLKGVNFGKYNINL